jgi:hypothetical protein
VNRRVTIGEIATNSVKGYTKAMMPGKSMKADIFLQLGTVDDNQARPQAWLAKIDLGRLDRTTRRRRKKGDIKFVYVKKGAQGAS